MPILLEIKNLEVQAEGKKILKGINLQIRKGQVQALLGPNASGKSTLAQVIAGDQRYKISKGEILFENKNISKLSPEKRVKLGIALAWQAPPTIKGVKLSSLLPKISKKKPQINEGKELLEREINVNFSGGEKKISELLQVIALHPKLAILDEIDSGLDIKKLEYISKTIRQALKKKKIALLIITHQGQLLNYLKPDRVNVMIQGKIICQEKNYKKVLRIIKKYGYEKCKKCKLLAD
ncbi:ABC transporter ATP-binding protein [bacterium]|nr:ABC transporter ATP-binding protein [bacterium]